MGKRIKQTAVDPPDKGEPGIGIECRGCGCKHFLTLSTRKTFGGRIIRRRECRYCGRRLTTNERVTKG